MYSSFWSDFFSRVTEGEGYRVPAINPHWQAEEWVCWTTICAPAFISAVLFQEHSVFQETLLNSYLFFLNKTERGLVEKETFLERKLSVDKKEDFFEMIDRFGSKKILPWKTCTAKC